MKKIILIISLILSGCTIVPNGASIYSEVRMEPRAVPFHSIYDRAYYWDIHQGLYFYWDRGYPVYMPRLWIPYHRHR